MKDSLSTLDLTERPGQRITWFHWVRHHQTDGPLELRPDERVFAGGPHHDAYAIMAESEERPANLLPGAGAEEMTR
jgi:hypothetical protein